MNFMKQQDCVQGNRNPHSANVCLIGNILQRQLDEPLAIENMNGEHISFSYLWSCAMLAHDMGCRYEKETEHVLNVPDCWNSVYMKRADEHMKVSRMRWYREHGIDILYCVPNTKTHRTYGNRCKVSCNLECERPVRYTNGAVVRRCRYKNVMKDHFFRYHVEKNRIVNHGIVGADWFYSCIVRSYLENYKRAVEREDDSTLFYHFLDEEGKVFSCEKLRILTHVANCVAVHDMHVANYSEEEVYVCFGLQELLPERYRKISYKKEPLLFILCVADAIEPSKWFPHMIGRELLDRMEIIFKRERMQLIVKIDKQMGESKFGKLYMQNVLRLSEYCEIRTFVQVKRVTP